MNLETVHIERYGPLTTSIDFDPGINVIYGPNESGKTLLVDALLWMLVEDTSEDRIGQRPFGYVTIDEGAGSYRLDDGETLLDWYKSSVGIELSSATFRDTFVIRSADATLTDEDRYYDRATDVVAESLVADIRRLRSTVAKRGRITSGSGRLWNRQRDGYIKDLRDQARTLRDRLREFIDEQRDVGVPKTRAGLLEARHEQSRLTEEAETLEAANERSRLDELAATRSTLEAMVDERESIPDAEVLNELRNSVKDALKVRSELSRLEHRQTEAAKRGRRLSLGTIAVALVALAIGGVAFATLGVSLASLTGLGLLILLAAAMPAGLAIYYSRVVDGIEGLIRRLEEQREVAFVEAARCGFEVDTLDDLAAMIEDRVHQRRHLEGDISRLRGQLEAELSVSGDSIDELLERTQEELTKQRSTIPTDVAKTYDETRHMEVLNRLEELDELTASLETELETYRDQLRRHFEKVKGIEFEKIGINPPETEVESLDGLDVAVDRLSALIARIERDADNARAAMAALTELEVTERSAVEELFFGTESRVSEYFARITDRRYRSVHYDPEAETIEVELQEGTLLAPEQLSQSTFDQLYFAVRLAFAQALLDDEPGIFILDDAFLAADADRFNRQATVLSDLEAVDWQVLYFTAKRHDRQLLEDNFGATVHELSQIESSAD